MSLSLLLEIVALICLLVAACNVPTTSRLSVGWLGMFFWLLSALFAGGVLLR